MLTLEQTICECTRKAEANRELSKYNKSHVDRANDLKNADDCEQLAAWLRELQERRKAPEIITCGKCKYAINIGTPDMMCNNSKGWVVATDSNFGCILAKRAERRTDD